MSNLIDVTDWSDAGIDAMCGASAEGKTPREARSAGVLADARDARRAALVRCSNRRLVASHVARYGWPK